jgi:hypothetical protein
MKYLNDKPLQVLSAGDFSNHSSKHVRNEIDVARNCQFVKPYSIPDISRRSGIQG